MRLSLSLFSFALSFFCALSNHHKKEKRERRRLSLFSFFLSLSLSRGGGGVLRKSAAVVCVVPDFPPLSLLLTFTLSLFVTLNSDTLNTLNQWVLKSALVRYFPHHRGAQKPTESHPKKTTTTTTTRMPKTTPAARQSLFFFFHPRRLAVVVSLLLFFSSSSFTSQHETQNRINYYSGGIRFARAKAKLNIKSSGIDMVHASHILCGQNRTLCEDVMEWLEPLAEHEAMRPKLEMGFEELARRFSRCPTGKRNGGDLGYFPRGEMTKDFDGTRVLGE